MMSEPSSCAQCGAATETGQLGTLQDPQLFWSKAEVKTMGRMRMVQPSGPRMAVSATRCTACGRLDLLAEEQ